MNFGGIPLNMLRIWGTAEPDLPYLLHPWLHTDAGCDWGCPMFHRVREGIYGVAGTMWSWQRQIQGTKFPVISHELFDQGK